VHTSDVYHVIYAKRDSESLMHGFSATDYLACQLFGGECLWTQRGSDLIDAPVIAIKKIEIVVLEGALGAIASDCHFKLW
jgi:hypothetical protein